MWDREPLEFWLMRTSYPFDPSDYQQALVHADLDELEAWLDSPPESRRREIPLIHGGRFSDARIDPTDLPRAQDLYRRVVAASGNHKTYAEESLLSLIACALDPSTIPFFVEMLDLAPPRGPLVARRRQFSLAALALLAYKRDDPDAIAALVDATHHPHPQARALAAYYLRAVYIGLEELDFIEDGEQEAEEVEEAQDFTPRRPIPPQLAERMAAVATHDPAFEPRFMARAFLRDAGQPMPLDNPGGAYALKVKFKHAKSIYRTIEVLSEQTLEDLHLAIQDALDWDNDHLYSFFLNGQRDDERYRFASPWEEKEEDASFWTSEGVIGELGLPLKHKFLYLFDYGDQHEFEIEVIGIRPQAEQDEYPRIVDSKGKAPAQYRYAEDEDEEDEADPDDEE